MPVIPNLRRSVPRSALEGQAPRTPITYVDTPSMDYRAWLGASAGAGAIATVPPGARVAVIGAGAAGLSSAYELLRCGVDVTVFEATSRIGGRLFTSPSSTGDGNVFEMGAMRFTPSEQVLHHYADVFNASGASTITFDTGDFPDPGVNFTYIVFQGQTYQWQPGSTQNELPPSYQVVSDGWQAFMEHGFASADGTIQLAAPDDMTTWLTDPQANRPQIVAAWQSYIAAFVNASLYDAVVRIFTDANAPGGTRWSETDLEFFGALGTGFGGFGPLFGICFLDIMRFVIDAVDSNQHGITTGVDSIVQGFLNQQIALPGDGTTTVAAHVVTQTPVVALAPTEGGVELTFGPGGPPPATFDRVVVATSHRSMELTMGLGAAAGQLAEDVADAIRRVHLECSSKAFVETSAFWSDGTWPRNVVGDTILRNFYTLTYPAAPPNTGALLFSYTWADDSVKQQTYADPQARMELLLRDLATISEPLAAVVADSMNAGTAQVVDWQNLPYFFGAFKLNQPGQDEYVKTLFYDFQKAGTPADTAVYLAGDSIGFLGGWVENALETGVNAAAGVAVSLGGTLTAPKLGPFANLDPALYDYSVPENAPSAGPTATRSYARRLTL